MSETGLSEEKCERYLYGDCALLAAAVHAKTGWEVVLIEDGPQDDPDVCHVLVRMPDGRLLDAAGPHGDYSGEVPCPVSEWQIPESAWRGADVMADAAELLRKVGIS